MKAFLVTKHTLPVADWLDAVTSWRTVRTAFRTSGSRHTASKRSCIIIQLICCWSALCFKPSTSWQHRHSTAVGISWQQPHRHQRVYQSSDPLHSHYHGLLAEQLVGRLADESLVDRLGSNWYGFIELIATISPQKITSCNCKQDTPTHTKLCTNDVIGTKLCRHIFSFQIRQYRSRIKAIFFIFLHTTCVLSATNEYRHVVISFFCFS